MTELITKRTHALYEISKLKKVKTRMREFKDEAKKQTHLTNLENKTTLAKKERVPYDRQ